MPELKDIYARKKEASGQVSTQTRTLALGMLAISWALLTVHDEPLKSMALHVHRFWILGLAVLSVLVIVCDMFQYVAITSMAGEALTRAEASNSNPQAAKYNNNLFAYKAQAFLYRTKFIILALAFALLVWIFIILFAA
jgi:hypothetical protein